MAFILFTVKLLNFNIFELIENFFFQNDFIEYKEVLAAQGVKIAAKDLEKVIAG